MPRNKDPQVLRRARTFSTGDISEICDVASRTVARWFDEGSLEGYRIPLSQDRRVTKEALFKFLRAHAMPIPEWMTASHKLLVITGSKLLISSVEDALPSWSVRHTASMFRAGFEIQSWVPECAVFDFSVGRADCVESADYLREREPEIRLIALYMDDEPDKEGLSNTFHAALTNPPHTRALARLITGRGNDSDG